MDLDESYVLAVETSSRQGSVAVGRGSVPMGEVQFTAGARHGVELIPAVDRVVREAGLSPKDLAVICVSAGPGSFTGLRVGFTFARCLSQVTGAKLVAVGSTDVIVENLHAALESYPGPIYLAPILDAKRKQVYTAGFRWQDGRMEKILTDRVLYPADLLNSLGRPLWITGEGSEYHRESFADQEKVTLVDRGLWLGKAQNVLKLGVALARESRFTPYHQLIPTYIRLPEAEERWQSRTNAKNVGREP